LTTAREQRLELFAQAQHLLGPNQLIVTAREWTPLG
jgi:hypothetical protein